MGEGFFLISVATLTVCKGGYGFLKCSRVTGFKRMFGWDTLTLLQTSFSRNLDTDDLIKGNRRRGVGGHLKGCWIDNMLGNFQMLVILVHKCEWF